MAEALTDAIERRSPWALMWVRLRRNRTAMIGLYTLGVLYGGALLAGPLAPYGYDTRSVEHGFHPPMITRVRLFDSEGRLSRPFVYGIRVIENRVYEEDRSTRYPIRFFVRGDEYRLAGIIRLDVHLFGVDGPGRIFVLGSDLLGRDLFSRLLYGAQISLSVGIVGITISTVIGMVVGGVAGYFGGLVDFVLMRLVEVLLAVPSLYFVLVMRQMFSRQASSTEVYLVIVAVLAFIGWAVEARVIRGMVLSIKEREYVLAARALGLGTTRIIVRHVLPNTLSFVIVTATLSVPFYILGEVALSFLGVGIQEPEASWGAMLNDAQSIGTLTSFPWILWPGILIFVAVMAWNFFGDGLRDAADPRA